MQIQVFPDLSLQKGVKKGPKYSFHDPIMVLVRSRSFRDGAKYMYTFSRQFWGCVPNATPRDCWTFKWECSLQKGEQKGPKSILPWPNGGPYQVQITLRMVINRQFSFSEGAILMQIQVVSEPSSESSEFYDPFWGWILMQIQMWLKEIIHSVFES